MKIVAHPIKSRDLKPGDLFSMGEQWKWDIWLRDPEVIGLKVYIRTAKECPLIQADENVYRIEVTE